MYQYSEETPISDQRSQKIWYDFDGVDDLPASLPDRSH